MIYEGYYCIANLRSVYCVPGPEADWNDCLVVVVGNCPTLDPDGFGYWNLARFHLDLFYDSTFQVIHPAPLKWTS